MGTFIDLTMPLEEGMQTFSAPWHPLLEISQMGRHGIENRETRKLVVGTHTGTHVDAPRHFVKNAMTIDLVSLDTLCGEAFLLDFSEKPDMYCIECADLEPFLKHKNVKRLILRFDWEKKALMTQRYYSSNPYLSLDAAEYLWNQGVRLLGMDTPQPDNPLNNRASLNDSPIHRYLLEKGVILVEYLVNLRSIPSGFFKIFVAPLLVKEGDGAPARCFGEI